MLRSRVVLVLLGVLVIAACWLPLTVRGDGTLTGMIRLQLTYPLGIGMFLLTLATLWAGCSGIAGTPCRAGSPRSDPARSPPRM